MSEDLRTREGWASLLAEVSSRLDLAATAHESGAFRQGRGVPDAATLLGLCLLYGCGHSLRQVCAWGAASGVAQLSNPALTQRLQHTAPWLARIAAALLDIPALGVLDIADAGYGRAGLLRRRLAVGGDVLIRLSWRSLRLRDPDRGSPSTCSPLCAP